MRDNDELSRWAPGGAFIVEQHPNHPDYLICEMETSRGCPYRCSFCTEPLYGNPSFRSPGSVVSEVESLYDRGARHFRLGRQADILAYGGDGEKPNPEALREQEEEEKENGKFIDYIFEPDVDSILKELLPLHVNMHMWKAVLESNAAEQGARMTAMDNATENAKELEDDLRLEYNRARQSAITTEISEIISGAQALEDS
jgi:radical SAM superfamily enzyme YgiQ (UPF0313 family)